MTYMTTRNNDNYMDNFFDDMLCNWGVRNSSYPEVNVYEDSKAFYLEAALPGYTNEDVTINVDKHVLHIASEKMTKKDERKYIVRERGNIRFDRAFSLPEGINEEAIEAEFKNGILTVTLPKLPVKESKKITVKVSA
ncbi:MAG: Hsp20/alpha crystallin family protein [Spirochaetales bacterium]|nr:Hsp20/alpha crystallin family protein [Spirochaetales bacterium]